MGFPKFTVIAFNAQQLVGWKKKCIIATKFEHTSITAYKSHSDVSYDNNLLSSDNLCALLWNVADMTLWISLVRSDFHNILGEQTTIKQTTISSYEMQTVLNSVHLNQQKMFLGRIKTTVTATPKKKKKKNLLLQTLFEVQYARLYFCSFFIATLSPAQKRRNQCIEWSRVILNAMWVLIVSY